jgi:hypothetical protein
MNFLTDLGGLDYSVTGPALAVGYNWTIASTLGQRVL